MFKNKLQKYFVFEVLKYYIFILFILTLLLWITQAAKSISLVTESGLPVLTYAKYIFFLLPKVISQVMLISFLISLFMNIIKFQTSKEIEIFWLSGISKKKVTKIVINISFLITLLASLFYLYVVPTSSGIARNILSSSEYSIINSLVKKNNFNSPVDGLTIFVHKNDNNGNLEKIYIFETNKTIISKKGRVVEIEKKNFLELLEGVIHEKNNNNNISTINFEKTLYDFTKYKTNIILNPKIQELDFISIIKEYKQKKNKEYLYELHKRIFKPLFIPLIGILCCFILYSNNEKINLNKVKISVFSLATVFILSIEIVLNLSTLNTFYKYLLYLLPLLGTFISYKILIKFLLSESKSV